MLLLRLATKLIDNALRYSRPDGEIHIATLTSDYTAVLHITNTGPIIRPNDLATLFLPFQRGSAPRVRSGGGAGLGLSIVQAITTAHNGSLTPTAQPTGGLDITIRLPGA